jgi:hypothetical protein
MLHQAVSCLATQHLSWLGDCEGCPVRRMRNAARVRHMPHSWLISGSDSILSVMKFVYARLPDLMSTNAATAFSSGGFPCRGESYSQFRILNLFLDT